MPHRVSSTLLRLTCAAGVVATAAVGWFTPRHAEVRVSVERDGLPRSVATFDLPLGRHAKSDAPSPRVVQARAERVAAHELPPPATGETYRVRAGPVDVDGARLAMELVGIILLTGATLAVVVRRRDPRGVGSASLESNIRALGTGAPAWQEAPSPARDRAVT